MFIGDAYEIKEGRVYCNRCGEDLGDADENVKYNLAVEEGSIANAGSVHVDPSRFVDDEMVFRKYYCPNCAHLVSTESVRKGDPPVKEFEIA